MQIKTFENFLKNLKGLGCTEIVLEYGRDIEKLGYSSENNKIVIYAEK